MGDIEGRPFPMTRAAPIRLEDLSRSVPRLLAEDRLPDELMQAPSYCFSLMGPPGTCGPRCADRIASFSAYFRKSGGQDRRYAVTDCSVLIDDGPHAITTITMPLATLRIGEPPTQSLLRSARKAARKARRLGYYYKTADPERYLDDIFAIRSSAKERQGRPMPSYYFERVTRILDLEGYCPRHDSEFYGIFRDGRLVAYCTVLFFGEFARLDSILGHKAYLHDAIMDLLVDEASRVIAETRPWVRGLNYLYATGWAGLAEFKANTGFLPQHTTFTNSPPAVARRIEAQLCSNVTDRNRPVGGDEKMRQEQRPSDATRSLARIPMIFDGQRRQPDTWSEPSGIHSVLRALALPAQTRVLCVGAGGNLTYSALSAIIDKGYLPLLTEWRSPELIANAEKSFGDRCMVIPREWKSIRFASSFELVVFDLYYISFMKILMTEFRAASTLVTQGGFLVVKFFYDIDSGMAPEDRQSLGPLYVRRFKRPQPSLAEIAEGFRGSAFHVHGLVDRANERAATKNLGWLVLRKVRRT